MGQMTAWAQPTSQESFYRAALVGLRVLEEREGSQRRFGAEADARWRAFAGHLGPPERLNLLLRDAATIWGAAFSPAVVFRLQGLTDDEPFGPDWRSLDDHRARRVWRQSEATSPDGMLAAFDEAAAAWGLHCTGARLRVLRRPPAGPLEGVAARRALSSGEILSSTTHVLVVGVPALRAVAAAFAGRDDLRWTEQVRAAAAKPGPRHLAGLTAVLLASPGPTALLTPPAPGETGAAAADAVRASGWSSVDLCVVSDDAAPESLDFVDAVHAEPTL